MTGSIRATFVLVLMFAALVGNEAFAETGDYTRYIRALEHRVGVLEREMERVSTSVVKGGGDSLELYQEVAETMKKLSSRIDSLKRRIWELERKQVVVEELRARVGQLEAEVLELRRKGIVAKERRTEANPSTGRDLSLRGRRRSTEQVYTEGRRGDARPSAGSYSSRWQEQRVAWATRTPEVVEYSYDYTTRPRPRDTVYTIYTSPFGAYQERMGTEVQYCAAKPVSRRKLDSRAVLAVLGFLSWCIAMSCAQS